MYNTIHPSTRLQGHHLKNARSPSDRGRPLRGRPELGSRELKTSSWGGVRGLQDGPGLSAPHARDHHRTRAALRSASRKIKTGKTRPARAAAKTPLRRIDTKRQHPQPP